MYLRRLERHGLLRPCKRDICCVPPGRDPDHAVDRGHSRCVERKPFSALWTVQVSLKDGVEILRVEAIGVDACVSRWDSTGTAQ